MGKSTVFAEVVQSLGVFSSLLTFCVGFAHVLFNLERWCDGDAKEHGCLGPLLVWNTAWSFAHDSNGDGKWRSMFSLDPNQFIDLWAPILVSVVTLLVHVPGFEWCVIGKTWAIYSMWFIFCALSNTTTHPTHSYGGNLGVISGCVMSIVAILSLIVNFSGETKSPIEFSILHKWFKPRGHSKGDSHSDDGDETTTARCCKFHSRMSVACVRFTATAAAVSTIVVGVVHVAGTFQIWCDPGVSNCFGPFLTWNPNDQFFVDSNTKWREVIGLAPATFFDLFCPLLFGIFTLACNLNKFGFNVWITNWWVMLLLYLCMAVFGNFGYAGNLGIMIGFVSCSVCLFSLIIVATDNGHHPPFVTTSEDSDDEEDGDEEDRGPGRTVPVTGSAPEMEEVLHSDGAIPVDLEVVSEAEEDEQKEGEQEPSPDRGNKVINWLVQSGLSPVHRSKRPTMSPKPAVAGYSSEDSDEGKKQGWFNFFQSNGQPKRRASDEGSQEMRRV